MILLGFIHKTMWEKGSIKSFALAWLRREEASNDGMRNTEPDSFLMKSN